jgi:hypothetical protein
MLVHHLPMVRNARSFVALSGDVVVLIYLWLLSALDVEKHIMIKLVVFAEINCVVTI